jgi:transcription elongation GreA/GreB family factor
MSRAFTKEQDDVPEPPLVIRTRRKGADTPAPPADLSEVGFGSTVVVEGVGAAPQAYTIVDFDETDLAAGRLGLDSPLAQALLGSRAGAKVVWHRPSGDRKLTVVSVAYDGPAPAED